MAQNIQLFGLREGLTIGITIVHLVTRPFEPLPLLLIPNRLPTWHGIMVWSTGHSMLYGTAWRTWQDIWYGLAGMACHMVLPGEAWDSSWCGLAGWHVYGMAWRAWHCLWYGLAGLAWYMVWSGGHGTITSDLRWNTHVSNVCTKANRTLGFLRRNLYSCPQEVKEAAYKGLVRPVLDYGSSVWYPPGVVLQEELESVQKRAARFVTGNYNYETGSMTGILG